MANGMFTRELTRKKLQELSKDFETIKFFEDLFKDVTEVLPNLSNDIEQMAANAQTQGAAITELRDDLQNIKSQISQVAANITDQSETDAKLLILGESLQKAIDAAEGLAYNAMVLGNSEQKQASGTAVLVGGTVLVNYPVTVNSRIFLTSQVDGGTVGFLRISAKTLGSNFTITSSNGADTSTVAYLIIEA